MGLMEAPIPSEEKPVKAKKEASEPPAPQEAGE